jgi:hypothetical protein
MPHYVGGTEGKREAANVTTFLEKKTQNNIKTFFFWAAVRYLWIFAFRGGLGT